MDPGRWAGGRLELAPGRGPSLRRYPSDSWRDDGGMPRDPSARLVRTSGLGSPVAAAGASPPGRSAPNVHPPSSLGIGFFENRARLYVLPTLIRPRPTLRRESPSRGRESPTLIHEPLKLGRESLLLGREFLSLGRESLKLGRESPTRGRKPFTLIREPPTPGREPPTLGREPSHAGTRVSHAETRASQAGTRASLARTQVSHAGMRASHAHTRASQAGTRASLARTRASLARTRASYARTRAAEPETPPSCRGTLGHVRCHRGRSRVSPAGGRLERSDRVGRHPEPPWAYASPEVLTSRALGSRASHHRPSTSHSGSGAGRVLARARAPNVHPPGVPCTSRASRPGRKARRDSRPPPPSDHSAIL